MPRRCQIPSAIVLADPGLRCGRCKQPARTASHPTSRCNNTAEAALKQAEAQRATYDARQQELDQKISAAATEYREAINRSLLHSFASMLFGKDPDKLKWLQLISHF